MVSSGNNRSHPSETSEDPESSSHNDDIYDSEARTQLPFQPIAEKEESHRDSGDPDNLLSEEDFVSLLRDVSSRDEPNQDQADNEHYFSKNEKNKNVNEILSRIRDEGPAMHQQQDAPEDDDSTGETAPVSESYQQASMPYEDTSTDMSPQEDVYIRHEQPPIRHESGGQKDYAAATASQPGATAVLAALGKWRLYSTVFLLLASLALITYSLFLFYPRAEETSMERVSVPLPAQSETQAAGQGSGIASVAQDSADKLAGILGKRLDVLEKSIDSLRYSQQELQTRLEVEVFAAQGPGSEALQGLVSKTSALEEQLKLMGNDIQAMMQQSQQGNSKAAVAKPRVASPTDKASKAKPRVQPAEVQSTARVATPKKGTWSVNLMSLGSTQEAKKQVDRFEKLGISTDVEKIKSGGKTMYRLTVPGFATRTEAIRYIKSNEVLLKLEGIWVRKI